MIKTPTSKTAGAKAKAAPRSRARAVHPPYDQAVRATLEGGRRDEIEQLLQGARNLKAEHGSFDALIQTLEDALRKAY
ncbi:MAG TPA: hypothetical protein VEA61_15430 [Allosphingosinicella sp.]|nr:hypothetical protein [Allosphingosinicella sp.]